MAVVEYRINPIILEAPLNPDMVTLGNRNLHVYATPEQVKPHIATLSDTIRMKDYEEIFVNLRGGAWIANAFRHMQNFSPFPIPIEYHRPKNGIGSERTIPIPEKYRQARILVFEDVLDRGETLVAMHEDAPYATFVVAVHKIDVPNQVRPPNVHIGVRTRNLWLGSLGMNIDNGDSQDEIRKYGGITFKPNS